jgi:hypothetical protein
MTAVERYFKASLGLVLLTALVASCAYTNDRRVRVAEVIPAQVCGGAVDSDGDGVTECNDRCPGTLKGEAVDADGCPLPIPEQPKPFRG